ncbi:MAG: universal stress protein [Planctomycetaceae bacterium]|nr:universal stress protein [Planctomycetaceae bacterium]
MICMRKILAPTDFSENSTPALETAVELARQFDAQLLLLHVVDDIGVHAMEMEMGAYSDGGYDLLEAEKRAAERLEKIALPGDVSGRASRHTMIAGPSEGICRFASEQAADVIVLSTHGRTGLARWVMGSVAEHVVRKSPCPVLTVHPEGRPVVADTAVTAAEC